MVCKAEAAGCGGPTVKDDNEAGRDFRRNPQGREPFSQSRRQIESALATTYATN